MLLLLKIWMCGGTLEIVPCSRVGHVFRSQRPGIVSNQSESDHAGENSLRVAEVWLDEYKEHFYNVSPKLRSYKLDVENRKRLRKKLHCKSFGWFLHAIYPEMPIPNVRGGVLRNSFVKSKKKQPNLIFKGQVNFKLAP